MYKRNVGIGMQFFWEMVEGALRNHQNIFIMMKQ